MAASRRDPQGVTMARQAGPKETKSDPATEQMGITKTKGKQQLILGETVWRDLFQSIRIQQPGVSHSFET